MPFAIAGPVLGAVAGAGVSSALGPSSQAQGGGDSLYTPTGLGTADQSWQQLLQQELAAQQGIQGTAAQSGYGGNYQNNANLAAGLYSNLPGLLQQQAQGAYGTQQSLLGAGQNLLNAGQQVYNTAFDPQNALFNQLSNQQQQQSGATNSMYGLGSSAAGAGVANQNQQNFDINWQNQQLQRQSTGLQALQGATSGYGTAAGQAAAYGQYGNQLQEAAPGYYLQAGATPYNVGMQLAGAPLTSAQSIQQGIIPYLNYGQGATSNAYNAGSNSAGALGSAVSSGISGLGTATQNAGGLANLFSGTTGSFGGGNFSGAFNSNPYYSGGGNSYGFTS